MLRRIILCGLIPLALAAQKARAESVDVALILAADVSRSIDADEFDLQRRGYAAAIANPAVLKAIRSGVQGAVAICFVEWSSPEEQHIVVDWQVIRDAKSAQAFATKLLAEPRSFLGRTSISAALDFAMARFAASGFDAPRRVLDVSGDGINNAGGSVSEARDRAVKAGAVINGLAIINERPNFSVPAHTQPSGNLPNYYRENVIGGPRAFLLQIEDFNSFGAAMIEKLVTELVDRGDAPRDRATALTGR